MQIVSSRTRYVSVEKFGAEFLLAEATGFDFAGEIKTVRTNRGDYSCFGVLLAVGAMTIYGAQVQDRTIMPGETLTLEDGVQLTVKAFQIEDETGRLDYASVLNVSSADGTETLRQEIRVNQPMSFDTHEPQ